MNPDKLDFIHVWAGVFEGSESDFSELFNNTKFFDGGKPCAFAEYLGVNAHDEDMFGWEFDAGLEIDLDAFPCHADDLHRSLVKGGVEAPNAIVYYSAFYKESVPGDTLFGLVYLGEIYIG